MIRVAYLCSADVLPGAAGRRADAYEVDHQLAALLGPCRAAGVELLPMAWDDPQALSAAAAVIGPTWDYTERVGDFLACLDALDTRMPLLNDLAIVRWNLDKRYLRELEAAGVSIVPTHWADAATPESVAAAVTRFGTRELVIKPVIGAGAQDQIRLPADRGAQPPSGPVMIQPFLRAIRTEGEWSVVCLGGQVSHAVRKLPADGDYRVQSIWGGTELDASVGPELTGVVERAVAAVPGETLLARVDLVRDDAGCLCVMELELIEPYLYPEQGPRCGALFAESLARILAGQGLAGPQDSR